MLDRGYLRERTDDYRNALKSRGANADLDAFLNLDAERRRIITQVEALKAQRNAASQEIAALKKGKQAASAQIKATKHLGDEIGQLDEQLAAVEADLRESELHFPNVPHDSVPVGPDEPHSRGECHWGEKPSFPFTPKNHSDLANALRSL